MAQQVKDLVVLLQLGLLLWHRFDPLPRNFHMPGTGRRGGGEPKKKGLISKISDMTEAGQITGYREEIGHALSPSTQSSP